MADEAGVRALLEAVGFDAAGVERALGGAPPVAVTPADAPLYRDRLQAPPPLAAAVRLMLLGDALPRDALVDALPPGALEQLVASELVSAENGRVAPRVQLTPFHHLLIAADPELGADTPRDGVLGVAPSSITLAYLTTRRHARRALDLGTGCGIQALLAAGHCDEVLGVDVSPRCVAYARRNARLNGMTNVRFAAGDWFEGVDGVFDTIVANLPYMLAPSVGSGFEDTEVGAARRLGADVVAGCAERLAPGGLAHVLCSWIPDGPDRWTDPVVGWLRPTGCDALVLRHRLEDVRTYVAARCRQLRLTSPEVFDAESTRWLDAFTAHGVEWIASGALVLRRRSGGRPWIAAYEDVRAPGIRAGDMVEAMIDANDLVHAGATEDELAALAVMPPPGVDVFAPPVPLGEPDAAPRELEVRAGAGVRVRVDAGTRRALDALVRGGRPAPLELPAATIRQLLLSAVVLPMGGSDAA